MKEVRIGMVLYGGVSLAVYMNGIVTEAWHMLRASRARQASGSDAPAPAGSAAVYAELLGRLAAVCGTDLRVVVDTVAGSSAGGVNGAVLAKAVVDGGDASVLNRVWIEEADIAALRAEPARRLWRPFRFLLTSTAPLVGFLRPVLDRIDRIEGLSRGWVLDSLVTLVRGRDGRATPLDGQYFARMIAATLRDMGTGAATLLPHRGTFDLFLTSTDLHGWPRRLPVGTAFHAADLEERLHAHVMAFRHCPSEGATGIGHDFDLTFAARATAGFPIAFAPVTYDDIAAAWREARPGEAPPGIGAFADRHLREHVLAGFAPAHARMIDGGVLDNKPFSDLARAIEDKPADHQVFRALIYVEPDPELQVPPPAAAMPTVLESALTLYTLFRHEPIYDDLQALQRRNERIGTLLAFRDAALDDARRRAQRLAAVEGLDWPVDTVQLDRWRSAMNRLAEQDPMPGHAGYVGLKSCGAADTLAALFCRALNYPADSGHGDALRDLVRTWLAGREMLAGPGAAGAGTLALLRAFDLPYRKRRIRALVQAVNALYGAAPAGWPAGEWRAALDRAKQSFSDIVFGFQREFARVEGVADELAAALHLPRDRLDSDIAAGGPAPARPILRSDAALLDLYRKLAERFTAHADRQNQALYVTVRQLPEPARTEIATLLVSFPLLDVVLFPLMDGSGVGDLAPVSVLRISPCDATCASDDPARLEGRQWEGFYGFLDRRARENDLLWGRLDGAERLVQLVTTAASPDAQPGSEVQAICRDFTRKAMLAILDEEAARPGSGMGDRIAEIRRRLS